MNALPSTILSNKGQQDPNALQFLETFSDPSSRRLIVDPVTTKACKGHFHERLQLVWQQKSIETYSPCPCTKKSYEHIEERPDTQKLIKEYMEEHSELFIMNYEEYKGLIQTIYRSSIEKRSASVALCKELLQKLKSDSAHLSGEESILKLTTNILREIETSDRSRIKEREPLQVTPQGSYPIRLFNRQNIAILLICFVVYKMSISLFFDKGD